MRQPHRFSYPQLANRRGRSGHGLPALVPAMVLLAVLVFSLASAIPAAFGDDSPQTASDDPPQASSNDLPQTAGQDPPQQAASQRSSRPRRMSPLARVYVDQVIRIMRERSLYREGINWDDFRARVFLAASSARMISDTYPAIEVALFLLEDPHSAFVTPGGMPFFAGVKFCRQGSLEPPMLPPNVGYVKVNSFAGWLGAQEFAEAMQAQIAAADRDDLAGWIVDLRGNTGGNMWPMIAGIGPILGEGTAGYFTSVTGRETAWGYSGGASWVLDGREVVRVTTPYKLRSESPKVAVLTDNFVMSSGETVLVSFLGRPNTRQFGETTCGLSTSRGAFQLFNGARLYLSTYHLANRERVTYGNSIVPESPTVDTAVAVQLAIDWLLQAEEPSQ
jgi:carboxyl-terminal processing protease